MGQEFVTQFDEFVATDYDLHVSNSTNDTKLYEDLRALSQAAIQNGQATISDLIAISQSESVQDIARRLQDSAARIQEENRKTEEANLKQAQEAAQMDNQAKQALLDFEVKRHNDVVSIEREKMATNLEIAKIKEMGADVRDARANNLQKDRVDTDKNGIDDYIDIRRTDIDENYKINQIRLKEEELSEKTRANLVAEELKAKELNIKNTQSTASK